MAWGWAAAAGWGWEAGAGLDWEGRETAAVVDWGWAEEAGWGLAGVAEGSETAAAAEALYCSPRHSSHRYSCKSRKRQRC